LVSSLIVWYELSGVKAWAHDSVYYLDSYLWKLETEGRWVNYCLFPILKKTPATLALAVDLLSLFYFSYTSLLRVLRDKFYSLLLSLLVLQSAPIYAQLMWPAVVMPSFVALGLATHLSKRLRPPVFYCLFGVLFFSTYSNLYYLLPLLHLDSYQGMTIRRATKRLAITICLWAGGFAVGVLCSNTAVYLASGRFPIKIGEFREPHYVRNIRDLADNIKRSFTFLGISIRDFAGNWVICIVMTVSMLLTTYRSLSVQRVFVVAVSALVAIAHFVVVVPVGILIQMRTLLPLWAGLFFVIFAAEISSKRTRCYLFVAVTILTAFFSFKNRQSLLWQKAVVDAYTDGLARLGISDPRLYKGLMVISDEDAFNRLSTIISRQNNVPRDEIRHLTGYRRWRPSALEFGFKSVRTLEMSRFDEMKGRGRVRAIGRHDGSNIYSVIGVTRDSLLVIKLNT
jgi:hypothetical protein